MHIPEEVCSFYLYKKKKSYIVIISAFRGWGLFVVKKKYLVIGLKNVLCWSLGGEAVVFERSLLSAIFGFFKNYFQYLALLGMGYKVAGYLGNKMLFRLGYSHRILLLIGLRFQVLYLSRQLFRVESRVLVCVKQLSFLIRKQRLLSVYKKRGLCFKGEALSLKESSKKTIV
jgi:hypothetical protein